MSHVIIQQGTSADLRQTADLLNDIIEIGGTTALTTPLSREALADWLMADPDRAIWHVAMNDAGDVLGFQWIDRFAGLPPEACEIGTFVKTGRTGLGIGSKLFDATKAAARTMGYRWINAEIRADNAGGLAYYQSRSFETYGRKDGIQLEDGTEVSKILKRYDL
ncbi:GNAT family N-acetyltransferase [Shimia sp. R11_0]|uniref:GNAT family N-acetyltransferase n=1 Tax=Shimia sp. R11_0 TaxID=2821096 RepID=UPI001ADAF658|nr:GNAT family N-acetyltransferase [Shimia sp. R11_0]MBO9476183.1 GNAT family N-acetyltransferase [Shimia sp. R11_0]